MWLAADDCGGSMNKQTGNMAIPSTADIPMTRRLRDPQRFMLPVFIVAMAVVVGAVEPRFVSKANLLNLIQQLAPFLILTVGQAFAIIGGGLDLSVAAVLAGSGAVGVIAMQHLGIPLGVAAMILTGLCAGAFNGFIITRFRVSPFITTLGTMSVFRGLTLVITGGTPLYDIPSRFLDVFGDGTILTLPVSGVIAICCVLLGAFVLSRTVFGRYVYAVGANTSAAYNSGVPIARTNLMIYSFSGLMAGIAALVLTSWVSAAQPLAGQGLELQSIAAVVIGGGTLTGGSGTMSGIFFGVVLLGMLSNALNMLGVSSFFQTATIGVIIIIAVVLDQLRSRA